MVYYCIVSLSHIFSDIGSYNYGNGTIQISWPLLQQQSRGTMCEKHLRYTPDVLNYLSF
jgi:hypothetical protein